MGDGTRSLPYGDTVEYSVQDDEDGVPRLYTPAIVHSSSALNCSTSSIILPGTVYDLLLGKQL